MIPRCCVGVLILLGAVAGAPPARAQAQDPNTIVYGLAPPSDFEWGCFDPCACPVLIRQPLLGTFELTKVASGPLFDEYVVSNVRWKVPDATTPVTVVGSGRYRRGGEVALQEQLTLDLSFDGGPFQHFDSGLVPPQAPFPEIRTTISIHGVFCFDSVVTVDAKPLGPASVDASLGADRLVAVPSPFRGSTDVEFSVSRDGRVDLAVFDVNGRPVRSLVRQEWIAAGRHHRGWDGLLDGGRTAPPGLYFIRFRSAEAQVTRAVVKLR